MQRNLISHDLSTVRSVCDDVMVLYAGRKVEAGRGAALGQAPLHPYSDLLVSSIPELRIGWLDGLPPKAGEMDAAAGALARSGSCPFFARCPVRMPGVCDVTAPPVRQLAKGSRILCHGEERELLELGVGARQLGLRDRGPLPIA